MYRSQMRSFPRRVFSISLLTSMFVGTLPLFASDVPTAKCLKVGQTTIYKNRKYTCVRKKIAGKWKLVWDQGVKIPQPQVSTSVKPSAEPTYVSETPTPSSSMYKSEILVAKSDDLALGKNLAVYGKNRYGYEVGYILFRNPIEIIALSATCPHQGCSVKIDKTGLLCPCHNALFDNSNGDVLRGPASHSLERIQVLERDGFIYVLD